ncbi:EMC8-like protein [Mya arenaria]|uniref:EMC8-like protein n=1 Tax=Mya arenaria TaxID=6604 RepID=A0ABY7EV04_MYAAR|nr:EMC8-like protein [Mya arenaria]
MADISVSIQAYAKLLLHAAKYPHCAVNGILLAEDSKNVKEKKQIKFIDSYCKSKGYVIGGYYQANEHLQDNDLNPIARHIGKKIHDYYPDACIFMIDNNRVNPESTRDVYKVFSMKDSADWKEVKNDTIDEDTRQTSAVLLEQEQFRYLTDFDNHLDNVANDWRNTQLNELISKCS